MNSEFPTSHDTVDISERSSFLIHSVGTVTAANSTVSIDDKDKSEGAVIYFDKTSNDRADIQIVQPQLQPVSKVDTKTGWRRFQGFLLTFVHVFAFAFIALVAKYLEAYHPFTVSVYRFQGIFFPSLLAILWSYVQERQKPEDDRKFILAHIWPPSKNGNWKTILFLCVRGCSGSASVALLLYSMRYIHIADTLVIQATAPIFTNLLAYFLLKEPLGIFPVCIAILSMLGVGIISRPPILTGAEHFDADILTGCFFSFGAMLFSVVSVVCLRHLKNVNFAIISFCLGTWGTFQSVSIALVLGVFQFPQGLRDILLSISMAALVFISQVSLTFALKKEEAGPVMLFRTLNCVVAFVLQKVFLNVPADIYSVLGASIVVIGVAATVGRKQLSSLPEEHKLRRLLCCVLK